MTANATAIPDAASATHDYRRMRGDTFYRLAILLGFGVVLLASWRLRVFHGFVHSSHQFGWLGYVARLSLLWAGMGLCMLLFRTLLWFRYRTPPLAAFDNAPNLTVVIPAYNEGARLADALN